jgi:hypothetical protein
MSGGWAEWDIHGQLGIAGGNERRQLLGAEALAPKNRERGPGTALGGPIPHALITRQIFLLSLQPHFPPAPIYPAD